MRALSVNKSCLTLLNKGRKIKKLSLKAIKKSIKTVHKKGYYRTRKKNSKHGICTYKMPYIQIPAFWAKFAQALFYEFIKIYLIEFDQILESSLFSLLFLFSLSLYLFLRNELMVFCFDY